MMKTIRVIIRIIAGAIALSMLLTVLLLGYIGINLLLFKGVIIPFVKTDPDKIVKKAVTPIDLWGENYILCIPVSVTGFNYGLIRDENGKRTKEYVLVSGVDFGGTFTYEFMTSGNTFVFYVVERIDHIPDSNDDYGEPYTEYIVDGWDILYPAKHDEVPITSCPKYVLKSDYSKIR